MTPTNGTMLSRLAERIAERIIRVRCRLALAAMSVLLAYRLSGLGFAYESKLPAAALSIVSPATTLGGA